MTFTKSPGRFESVEDRHRYVQQNDVRLQQLDGLRELSTIGHFTHDLPLGVEQVTDMGPHGRNVIGNEDT